MHKVSKAERIHKQEGMALVMTLLAVSFLVAITVQLATSVNWQMQGAGNLRDSVQLDAVNRSGLSLVRAALLADFKENEFDSEHDSWDVSGEDVSSLFDQGTLQVKVTDLSGLLQINGLVPDEKDKTKFKEQQDKQKELWKRLLTSGKFAVADEAEADEIISAIIDWIDKDDNERTDGAESGFYSSLSPSYAARNAPLTYREELLLIRGMTKELFYGNEDSLGLVNFVTVAGRDGKININSAPVEILMALSADGDMSEETARSLVEFREDEDNMAQLGTTGWYNAQGNHALDEYLKDLLIVTSSFFKVSVTAKYKNMARSGTGIIQRDNDKKGAQKLLYWEVR